MSPKTATTPAPAARIRPEGIDVRFWHPGDTEAANALYNDPVARPPAAARGYLPRTAAQWSWEYARPANGPPAYAVSTHRGAVVGTQAYIPIEFLLDGRILLTGKDEDTLIAPAYRGLGLLDEMYLLLARRATADGVSLWWGFTNTAVRPLLRNGYHSIGRFEAMRADLSMPHEERGRGLTVAELADPDSRCDECSTAFGRQAGGITLHLSADYLRWRVLENPHRPHALFAAWRGTRLVGLGVFKLETPQKTGLVSELTAVADSPAEREATLRLLLNAGLRWLAARGCRWAEARFSGPHPCNRMVRAILAGHGFRDVPNPRAAEFLVRPLGATDPRVLDLESWRISELMREY